MTFIEVWTEMVSCKVSDTRIEVWTQQVLCKVKGIPYFARDTVRSGVTLNLHETHWIHTLMNVRKAKFIA